MKHSWHDPHIIRTGRSLLKALYLTCGIFVGFFVVFHIASAFYTSHLSEKQTSAFHSGIAQDIAYLKNQGDEIIKNDALITELLNRDREGLLGTLEYERQSRSIGLMGLADSEGVILGRTMTKGKYGDNVFLTSPAGRVVAQGRSVQSIEETSFGNQIFMTTARPIIRDSTMIGALFANYLFDDTYTTRFRDKYLSNGTEIVFYTNTYGVYGDSFSDPAVRKLISSYFNTGSDWIKERSTNKTVSFGGSSSYLVQNIVFSGLEQSPGGVLIFIPRNDISGAANIATALFTLLTFLIFAFMKHRRTSGSEQGWRYYTLLAIFSIPVFGLTYFALHAQNLDRLRLEHIPYMLYNSIIRLQPEFGIYTVGSEQSISIIVETGDESINTVQASLLFDPQKMEIKSLDIASSTCSYVIEKVIDQKAGLARVSCVIVDHGAGQHSLAIADVVLTPLKSGTFKLSFDPSETMVLASDGLGTNVLRMTQDGSYRSDNFNVFLTDEFSATTTVSNPARSFIVFSPSHPNESRWYNLKNAHFVWRGKADAVYRYAFDSVTDTVPTNEHTIQGSTIDVPLPGDGVYYFHLQLASGGPIAHYRIQSDVTPPTIIGMKLSQEHVVVGDVARFSFDAEDPVSGIQHNYYVDLGNRLFLPVGSQLFIPFLEAGDQSVTLRVYDAAGNYSDKVKVVHVDKR